MWPLALFILLSGLPSVAVGQAPSDTGQPYMISARNMRAQIAGQDKITWLKGEVELVHGSTVIRGDSAWASSLKEQATIWGRVTISDRDIQMSGQRASYYKKLGKAVLYGNPVAREKGWTLTAESLAYFREPPQSQAFGRVHIVDSTGKQQIWADQGRFWHQPGYGQLTGQVSLEMNKGGRGDQTLTADKIEIYRSQMMAVATGDVHFVQDSSGTSAEPDSFSQRLEAACGRATYYRNQGRLAMEISPRIWQPEAELSAQLITIGWERDSLRDLEAWGSVGLKQFLPSGRDTDLITGDSLRAEFRQGRLDWARAWGRVWSLYHQKRTDNKPGRNIVQGEEMIFRFSEGRLSSIKIWHQARGAYFIEE